MQNVTPRLRTGLKLKTFQNVRVKGRRCALKDRIGEERSYFNQQGWPAGGGGDEPYRIHLRGLLMSKKESCFS